MTKKSTEYACWPTRLLQALEHVLEHYYADERDDYLGQPQHERRLNHIYHSLRTIRRELRDCRRATNKTYLMRGEESLRTPEIAHDAMLRRRLNKLKSEITDLFDHDDLPQLIEDEGKDYLTEYVISLEAYAALLAAPSVATFIEVKLEDAQAYFQDVMNRLAKETKFAKETK